MTVTPQFTTQSAFGNYRGTPKSPTSMFLYSSTSSQVKAQNDQLLQLKEQYLRLKAQYIQESKDSSAKIMSLERQLRTEQQELEKLEKELAQLRSKGGISQKSGSIGAVEKIWNIMNDYREQIKNGALQEPKSSPNIGTPIHINEDDEDEIYTRIQPRAHFAK